MKKQTTDALRDLLLLTVGSVLPVLLGVAATKGVFHLTMDDLERVAGAALSGFAAWAAVFLTPITRRYGVGSSPAQSDAVTWADMTRRPTPEGTPPEK